jgi:hypothetical protein
MIDYAEAIKGSISCKQFAEFMGLQINRTGFAVCPFHGEKTASLKIYKGGRGWYCFGCHKGGDVISLASLYYGLGFKETLQRLNDDFNLGLMKESTETGKNRVLMAVEIAKRKTARLKEQRQRDALEAEYWMVFDKWLDAEKRVIEAEPKNPEEGFPQAFCDALTEREQYKERLSYLETERIIYDNHNK